MTIWSVGGFAIVQGLGMIWGGPHRWLGPAYAVVRQAPGSPYTWGAALVLFGCLTLSGSVLRRWRVKAAGLLGVSLWSGTFSIGAFAATLTDPDAGTTGGPAYLLIAFSSAILIHVDEAGGKRVQT